MQKKFLEKFNMIILTKSIRLLFYFKGYGPRQVFTQFVEEKDPDTGLSLGWESRPDFCRILAMERLTPVIGVQVSLSFYSPEIAVYKACRVGVAKVWLKEAIQNCPNAAAFLKLPPLKAKKGPLNFNTGLETGFEIPLLRIRRTISASNDEKRPGPSETEETVPSEGRGIFGFPVLKRDALLRATCVSAVNISRSAILEKHGFGQRMRDMIVR